MSRPSAHLDQKLIATARELLPQTGFSGLSVREVARRAGVNIGMFHYLFKSKNAFVHRVLEDVYGDFLTTFLEAAETPGSARERLRAVLVAYAHFARSNRVFYAMMMRELLGGHPEMAAFAREYFPKHAGVLMTLIERCRRDKSVRELPTPVMCMFAMSSMAAPNLVVTGLESCGQKKIGGMSVKEFGEIVLSDGMIEARADMVLAALAPQKKGVR